MLDAFSIVGMQGFLLQFDFMRFYVCFLLFFMPIVFATAASAQTVEEQFRAANEAIAKADWPAARTNLERADAQQPDQPDILYNLGVVEMKSGRLGLAIALWRKALAIDPESRQVALALSWAQPKLGAANAIAATDVGEWLHQRIFSRVPMRDLLFLALLLLAASTWTWLRFVRKRRLSETETATQVSPWAASVFSVALVSILTLLGAQVLWLQTTRATVIAAKVDVRTTPSPDSASLYELFEGNEVLVRQSEGEWAQVSMAGGLTGWLPLTQIYVTHAGRLH